MNCSLAAPIVVGIGESRHGAKIVVRSASFTRRLNGDRWWFGSGIGLEGSLGAPPFGSAGDLFVGHDGTSHRRLSVPLRRRRMAGLPPGSRTKESIKRFGPSRVSATKRIVYPPSAGTSSGVCSVPINRPRIEALLVSVNDPE